MILLDKDGSEIITNGNFQDNFLEQIFCIFLMY